MGERRLKNAVMVLEWVPDTTQLRTLPSATGALSAAQEERLRRALSLLDLRSRGGTDTSMRFGPHELREALQSAEDLMLTDADCQPPPSWVRSTVAAFGENVGLVAGYALPPPGRGILSGMLSLDNQAVAAMGAGSIGMGRPLSCTGRSLAYLREVYEEVGGFASIGHLIGGDDVYFTRLVAARTRWRIAHNWDPEAAVGSGPAPDSWSGLLHQKLRHAAKAGHYRGPALAVAAGAYAFHFLLLLGLMEAVSPGRSRALVASVWAAKWVVDALLVWTFTRKMRQSAALAYLPLLELSYIPYVLVCTVVGRLGWFRWKPPLVARSTNQHP